MNLAEGCMQFRFFLCDREFYTVYLCMVNLYTSSSFLHQLYQRGKNSILDKFSSSYKRDFFSFIRCSVWVWQIYVINFLVTFECQILSICLVYLLCKGGGEVLREVSRDICFVLQYYKLWKNLKTRWKEKQKWGERMGTKKLDMKKELGGEI